MLTGLHIPEPKTFFFFPSTEFVSKSKLCSRLWGCGSSLKEETGPLRSKPCSWVVHWCSTHPLSQLFSSITRHAGLYDGRHPHKGEVIREGEAEWHRYLHSTIHSVQNYWQRNRGSHAHWSWSWPTHLGTAFCKYVSCWASHLFLKGNPEYVKLQSQIADSTMKVLRVLRPQHFVNMASSKAVENEPPASFLIFKSSSKGAVDSL